ncbi:MAG: YhbY family RNA-binding protein [Candidatus Woesearchaeota archaeon]
MKHANIVHLQLGKNGVTESVLTEIQQKLPSQDPLVIKMNQSFTASNDRKAAAASIAEKTNSRVESLVGGTLILTRRNA